MFGSTAGASSVGGGGGFGTPSTPAFTGSSLFTTPFSAQSQSQQSPFFSQQLQTPPQLQFPGLQTTPPLQQQQQTPPQLQFPGLQTPPPLQQQQPSVNAASLIPFTGGQLTTQMAPVTPLPFSLADRDIQAIVDAYKEDPANPKYGFKHLLFSVTDLQFRAKLAGVSDIMWAEAMGKLEGMDRADRERLWPQLVQGFKDLSNRLKLQDGVILSDADRLKTTQTNVKMLQRHFQADTLPRIQRMRQKEQNLQRRLLRVMRIVEALEGKGFRLPFVKGEAQLAEKLAIITKQLKGSGAELSRRVQSLLAISRSQANGFGAAGSLYLPGSTKIDGQSLADLQEVLQQQTAAIARLGNVLKRDIRDMEIMMAEDTEMTEDAS